MFIARRRRLAKEESLLDHCATLSELGYCVDLISDRLISIETGTPYEVNTNRASVTNGHSTVDIRYLYGNWTVLF